MFVVVSMTLRAMAGLAVMTAGLFGQTLEFEVASIRPSAPIIQNANTQVSAGVHIDGRQFRASTLTMRDYLAMAYNVRSYQIEAPDWVKSERFDINAKMPELPDGRKIDEKEFGVMVRALIEDRFQLKAHHIQKEFPVYALVQAKGGIKAVENSLEPQGADGVTVGGTGGAQGTVISLGRGSTLSVGANRIEGKKFTMAMLADTLARFVDRPVKDETGLTSAYDITLDMTQEDFQALMIRAGIAAGVTMPPQALALLDKASGDSLHEALAKMGLKLEPKKTPMDFVVVDSINRTPTEN